jgi:Holliday junction resolvase RusA-like endonuclease
MRRIIIPGDPIPKASVRVYGRRGIKTTRTQAGLDAVAHHAREAVALGRLEGPLRMRVVFSRHRPQRLKRRRDSRAAVWAPTRPDVDNYLKLLSDGLKALWGDDAQVVHVEAAKVYAPVGCEPCTVVDVWPAGDVPAWALDMLDAAQAASDGGAP